MPVEEVDVVELTKNFHSLYRVCYLKKNERKQNQKRDRSQRGKGKQKPKILLTSTVTTTLPLSTPIIEILGNASIFAAYASVRQIVLEFNFADASRKWLIPLEDNDSENDNAVERLPSPVSVPKIVGLGLETVFQLVQESHTVNTSLCVKALTALLNILEGQHPQSLKKEPISVIDSMFSMLLVLSKFEEKEVPSSSTSSASTSSTTSLTSVATACLISLAIARGETKSMFQAIASLFMCPQKLASQKLKNPNILKSVQRSAQAVLVGRPILPQWLNQGIPVNSCVDSFTLSFPSDPPGSVFSAKSLATDGRYLFLHCSRGLYKIGSGCFGTEKGKIYAYNNSFHTAEKVWIGWASGKLFCRIMNSSNFLLLILDQTNFDVVGTVKISDDVNCAMFSDGISIGAIVPAREDGFLARTVWIESGVNPSTSTAMSCAAAIDSSFYEINLRLVRKSIEVAGPCPWDNDSNLRPVTTGVDEDVVTVSAGKDFALLRTQHGRIMYCGKGSSLGQKSGIAKCSKWLELGLSKCPRFVQCSVGHEGIHSLLLTEDGTAYFVGTPKRGEDGDQAKIRRVAKASKPKKVIRMDGHDIVSVACNNGTSAFVTRSGDVYMFGKDTTHCDSASGYLLGLRGVFVTQISMGKAHSVILTGDGKVYTMGINNKGQCGRSYLQLKEDGTDILEEDDGEWEDGPVASGSTACAPPEQEGMCPAGSHRWKHEQCMVCTVCRECTGYGSACISALRPDRNPGQECGCGVGDAGCAECGSCRTCAREGIEDQDYLVMDPQRPVDPAVADLINLEEDRALPPDDSQDRRSVGGKPISSSTKSSKPKSKENSMTSFPPCRLNIPTPNPISQIACGLHHSVFLDAKGSVFVCGSNSFGQLGLGDLTPRHTPVKVRFPDNTVKITQIASGSYHTVALDNNGVVYTCGAHVKGQLARVSELTESDPLWFSKMSEIPNVGAKFGRRVTWIGATGDSTFIRLEASLISQKILKKSTVTANSISIMIIPPLNTGKTTTVIMINRRDGSCSYFEGESSIQLPTSAAALDPIYDFLWTYEWRKHTMKCHNVIASSVRNPHVEANMCLMKPPYAIPIAPNSTLERWQAGASMLACMDTLIAAHIQGLTVHQEEQGVAPVLAKMYSRDDYSAVCRFESHGGGWGYSGHSIEAIRFSCDADILLGGFGLFGGRGEYCAKIKIFDIGPEGGEVEGDGELLAETEEIPYDCGPRQKYRMMFEDPIALQAGRWYVAWSHISGPSSDCGSSGQGTVSTEDQVTFSFKSSKKSNNGTDVNAGQIPQILYRLMTSDSCSSGTKTKQCNEPAYLLTSDFVSNFTPGSVQILMSLIQWCWEELQSEEEEESKDAFSANLMKSITRSCLRLIEFSINQAYPYKGCARLGQMENSSMAEAIASVRVMLHNMISAPVYPPYSDFEGAKKINAAKEEIISQCCSTFENCFQVFYPTSALKWECLANFMYLYLEHGEKYARMLGSVVGALCRCRGQLLGIFPVLSSIVKQSPDETCLTFVTNTEGGKLKQPANNRLLVGQMASRNDMEGFVKPSWSFWEVMQNLLTIINMDEASKNESTLVLVHNSSLLLAKLMEELVSHASGVYAELESVIGQIIVATPCRFTRTNQSRTWNTGNGSPDAVCFTVDQPGVSVFGCCIYSGTGTYEYEVELFQEVDEVTIENCDQPNPKWTAIEIARGTFDSDECIGDIAEIRFPKAVQLKPSTKYALRLKNHGGRTCNGDGGVSVLRCSDGTTFTFSSCPLSFNGTNQIRGQIPHLLYFRNPDDSDARQKAKAIAEMQARKCALRACTAVFENAKKTMESVSTTERISELSGSSLVTTLLPSLLAHLPHLAMSDPRSSVELLQLISLLLPPVSDLNNRTITEKKEAAAVASTSAEENISRKSLQLDSGGATSPETYYSWVETDHPYKPAVIAHYKVTFPAAVQMITVEFDPRCCTAQAEDSVRMFVPYGALNGSGVPGASPSTPFSTASQIPSVNSVPAPLAPFPMQNKQSQNQQFEHPLGVPLNIKPTFVTSTTTTESTSDDPPCLLSYIPIMERFSGNDNWPKRAIILPGNEVLFSLETASDYARADKQNYFGFRCLVTGFEWKECFGLARLEMELAYLGGFCAHELIKRDLVLPPVSAEEVETSLETSLYDDKMIDVCLKHHALFAKGIGLEYFPGVQEALDGIVPLREKSKEREFIADFIARSPGTSGERLANWLQPESFVDPQKCEVVAPKDALRQGKPTHLIIITRDQFGNPAVAPNLQVEMKAMPIRTSEPNRLKKITSSKPVFGDGGGIGLPILPSGGTAPTTTAGTTTPFGVPPPPPSSYQNLGASAPPASSSPSNISPPMNTATTTFRSGNATTTLRTQQRPLLERQYQAQACVRVSDAQYQITVKDKMRYHAITMMKEYENVSFEELRLLSPSTCRSTESMLVRQNNNGTYTATWTPACTGLYHISLTVDGYSIPQVYVVEVEEGPEGSVLPAGKLDSRSDLADFQFTKMRKFKATDSAGLRIRSHPSLQSEQIGCLPINGVISFTQEIHNDDGIWVKLDEASVYAYCDNIQAKNFRLEGWCLQYNQHVGKTFLFPVEGPKPLPGIANMDKGIHKVRKLNESPFTNTDASSKLLRLNGSPGQYQVVKCGVSGHNIRTRPCLRSPPVGILVMGSKFYAVDECYNNEGLWVKLDPSSQRKFCFTSDGEAWSLAIGTGEITYLRRIDGTKIKQGFDFSVASHIPQNIFHNLSPPAAFLGSSEAISISEPALPEKKAPILEPTPSAPLPPLLDPAGKGQPHHGQYSVASTPVKKSDESVDEVGKLSNVPMHRSLPCSKTIAETKKEEEPAQKSPRSRSSSTFGALQKWLQMGAENRPSLPSASSIPHLKQASSVVEVSKSLVKERINAISGSERAKSAPTTVSSATQTSPEANVLPTSVQFNIGTTNWAMPLPQQFSIPYTSTALTSNITKSPKSERKRKGGSSRVRTSGGNRDKDVLRGKSPQPYEDLNIRLEAPTKDAIGPGQAQSLRAVFGAVLWHAGIIHDAMACASYLRFHKQSQQTAVDPSNSSVFGDPNVAFAPDEDFLPKLSNDSMGFGGNEKGFPSERKTSGVGEEDSKKTENISGGTEKVVMRKKSDSPAKGKHQRHSVEVTSAAWYLKGNPDLRLEPLKGLAGQESEQNSAEATVDTVIANENETIARAEAKTKKNVEAELFHSSEGDIPPAVTILEKIWAYVKRSCVDSFNTEEGILTAAVVAAAAGASSSALEFKSTVKLRRDMRRYGKSQSVSSVGGGSSGGGGEQRKSRKEQPRHLHTMGRSFLLEPDEQLEFLDETSQCEICHVRFSCKGKSRKAHFGLSSLCENCSERQLKIKKQQQNSGKRPAFCPVTLESGLQKCLSQDDGHPYSVMLNNALFLLQMINTLPESHLSQTCCSSSSQSAGGLVPAKSSFNCLTALGVTESQVMNDEDLIIPEIKMDIRMRRTDGKLSKEKRSASTMSTAFEDSPWEGFVRRRKASNGDQVSGNEEGVGFTLLHHPSPVLQKIVDAVHDEGTGIEEAIERVCGSVLSFVTERYDLENLRLFLFQAIRRVTCRSYGMKILAWLMRSVSHPTALHDLLWWYASSLEFKDEDDYFSGKVSLDDGWWQMRAHPLNESPATVFPFLSESFYSLLQTIADIMPVLPIGSSLLEMAVKCWGVYFTRKDHRFLHKSKIFRNLSQIMSQFDGENERSKSSNIFPTSEMSLHEVQTDFGTTCCLADFSHALEIKVSSRAALSASLTDESTETFWESGDEDRNRTKSISIGSLNDFAIKVVAIYVDNGRDSQYKVSSISVKVGHHQDEYNKIGQIEIDSRHFGWIWFPVESEHIKAVKVELKGPDNTLRVRQMKILGIPIEADGGPVVEKSLSNNAMVAQRKCENETLRIFRLLSSEVFGKFLYGVKRGDNDAEGNDLQEHVVGILFSRSKLTHLQKQVCSHIVSAIHREAVKIKEEFDSHLTGSILEVSNVNVRMISGEKSKIADRYCFEMLTLVLALADHKLGRSYLSQQSNLIQDLMQLFHAGTPRIQRQVTSVVRKILPEIEPTDFAKIICYQHHSPTASSLKILDMFLGCVVKSLQVKVRSSQDGNRFARNINICDMFGSDELPSHYWFLRGEGEIQLANAVVKLIKDMCEDSFSVEWAKVSKQAIADSVLYLTRIDSNSRNSTECLNSPQFWLALAALCVLHPEHSKLLSSPVFQNGSSGRAKCINHDDGETMAVIQCHDCGDLCTECDRVLHLPKKKWPHVRNVCKEEEESVRVDLHEGCGRIKLFWLMALADSSTLKALVEFRNGIPKTSVSEPLSNLTTVGRCRFCSKVGNSGPLALGNVCGETECQEYSKTACERVLECGHLCGGVKNETKCLPCLQGCSDKLGTVLKQDGDDMCMICFTDALAFAPAILLVCGHVFHYHCCRSVLEKRWPGPRITFSFSLCPICKVEIAHSLLDDLLNPCRELFDDVKRKALMRLEYEGLNTAEGIVSPGGRYFQDPSGFAMDRYAYYVCYKCKKAYFGGEARCDAEIQMEFDPSELVCGGCSDISQAQLCPKHGTDYLEYKCRYCCSVAVFFCFGTTHFCNGCHDDFQRITTIPRNQLPRCPAGPRAKQLDGDECPLHVSHPPTGEEFALGCGICRNAHTF